MVLPQTYTQQKTTHTTDMPLQDGRERYFGHTILKHFDASAAHTKREKGENIPTAWITCQPLVILFQVSKAPLLASVVPFDSETP